MRAAVRTCIRAASPMRPSMSIRLVQCDARGEPVESLGPLPRVLQDNVDATAGLFAA